VILFPSFIFQSGQTLQTENDHIYQLIGINLKDLLFQALSISAFHFVFLLLRG